MIIVTAQMVLFLLFLSHFAELIIGGRLVAVSIPYVKAQKKNAFIIMNIKTNDY